jgi:hypothetical protein
VPAYHIRFRHFDRRTLTATSELFEARTSAMLPTDALVEFGRWVDNMSAIYEIPRPVLLIVSPSECGGFGRYMEVGEGTILLPRPSVTTLFHLWRYHMQHHGATMVPSRTGPPEQHREEDARAWSLSLYHQVRPRLLARVVGQGRILHLTPADLQAAAA